jgi:hypothetical protein
VLQFDRYEFRVVDAGGNTDGWHALREPRLAWPSPAAGSALDVRGVNVRGVAGPSAKIAVDAPAPPKPESDLAAP